MPTDCQLALSRVEFVLTIISIAILHIGRVICSEDLEVDLVVSYAICTDYLRNCVL